MEKKVKTKSKIKTWKIGLQLMLLAILGIVLSQNAHPVDIELLFWEVHVPLVFLLIGTAVLGALLMFVTVLIKGSR